MYFIGVVFLHFKKGFADRLCLYRINLPNTLRLYFPLYNFCECNLLQAQ